MRNIFQDNHVPVGRQKATTFWVRCQVAAEEHGDGAMDLAWGGKKVVVAMMHTTKEGKPKIVKELSLPLTAKQCVDLIVTDVAVIEVSGAKGNKEGLILKEVAPGWSAEEVQEITERKLIVTDDLKEIEL